jgi:ankyrin repeat protein
MAKSLEQQLFDACKTGDLNLVKDLVSQGADIHACEDDDALRCAAFKGHLEIVKYLVSQGADIHAYEDGALRWAACDGHLEIVKGIILVEKRKKVWQIN